MSGAMMRGGLRPLLLLFGLLAVAVAGPAPAMAGDTPEGARHGLSAFGELKYPPDFKHFDYVNPDAPVGGSLSMIGTAGVITFNSFNPFIIKGDAAQGMALLFDSLMTRAYDEPDAVYGLVAHSAKLEPDRSGVTFYMRPEAEFADGSPVTAEDVVFTYETLKRNGRPIYNAMLRDVEKAEALDDHTVRFTFNAPGKRRLPMMIAELPILSKAYYQEQPFNQSTLEPPLGSGPYEVVDFKQGRFVTLRRREGYWGWHLPVNQGRYNFGELRYEYFRDRTAELEALKAGEFDLREEFTSKSWATEYDIQQVRSGQMKLLTLEDGRPSGAQGFFINTRREKFADRRVRLALDYAFDFQWTNKHLFYGLYERTASYFENSALKAQGKPSEAELALLEPYRDQLPESVFEDAYVPPKSDGSGRDRRLLRQASRLLNEAGWVIRDGRRVNAETGEPLEIEFLIFSPTFERVIGPYVKNLEMIGIDARIRRVDPSQFQERMKSFDFDITTQRFVLNQTPGPELRNYFGSDAAGAKGSFNLAGVSSPVVDALIDEVLAAETREEMQTAARALDRVLRAGHYWVPQWYKTSHHLAFWNKFSWPETKPPYDRGVIETWWYDEDKAARLEDAR
ncbi:extracellular solute-binding protein [Dichotomicrobium thermohalophilum]|uniref:Microcin C transport system substrate-binding protein n=1 Tax=Dichotomicrobium thermohalophilum TaxID=933063 RepID=A0A397QB00_9HYPH|nr:extracellular solute-binding protein [Dichotomicrobium thermohalophilum]RIA55294.1 microcin C transport system substrate-binding protein [Dichotomicrobium thermohalophilum]